MKMALLWHQKKSYEICFCILDQVKQELVCYFDRLQHGIPNLKDLARIETKVCQHFGFQNFLTLSRAKKTFLEFLSIDHPGVRKLLNFQKYVLFCVIFWSVSYTSVTFGMLIWSPLMWVKFYKTPLRAGKALYKNKFVLLLFFKVNSPQANLKFSIFFLSID